METSGDYVVQPYCSEQGLLQQVDQDCGQLAFELLRGGRLHNLSGQTLPLFIDSHSDLFFLMFKPNFLYLN